MGDLTAEQQTLAFRFAAMALPLDATECDPLALSRALASCKSASRRVNPHEGQLGELADTYRSCRPEPADEDVSGVRLSHWANGGFATVTVGLLTHAGEQ